MDKINYVELLNSRGVKIEDIAEITYLLQIKHYPEIEREICIKAVESVLEKREVQHALITGVELDVLAEKGLLVNKNLEKILKSDYGLYGVDEVLAYGICNLYGSIALTNFGFVDKEKVGILKYLNEKNEKCHTFLDDIVGAVAASAASKIAHTKIY